MTVQPAASAGPILRVAIAAGKFHGVIRTEMPIGFVVNQDVVRAGRGMAVFAGDADSLFGIPAKEFSRIGHFAAGVGQSLAIFQRDERCKIFGMDGHQLEPAAQDFCTLARRCCPPALRSRVCCVDSARRILDRGIGDFRQKQSPVEGLLTGIPEPFSHAPPI